jgi:hypothetical protein
MLPFAESFLIWIASTAIPAFVGVSVVAFLGGRVGSRYLAAFALGIFFWFFVDTIEGSSDLNVGAGLAGGASQLAMVILFAAGVLVFFSLDKQIFSDAGAVAGLGLAVPLLAAVAVGVHGFGEGTAYGSTAALTSSTSVLDAFGGVSAGVAYALHKMFEPMMPAALYAAYAAKSGKGSAARARDALLLTLLFVVPSILGAATGYFISYDATYFFALGTGTSIYAAFRLWRQVFSSEGKPTGRESLKVAVALILGFILIYAAALLHS